MHNALKVLIVIVLSVLTENIVEYIFLKNVSVSFGGYFILSLGCYLLLLAFFWSLFLRDNNNNNSFFQKILLKKTFLVVAILIVVLYTPLVIFNSEAYRKRYTYSHLIDNNVYYNSQYNFKLTYPDGSYFNNTNTEGSFVTRFFLPNGKTIGGDQENIGIHVEENSNDIDVEIKDWMNRFSANGPIDIKEVQFGGQKGYRFIVTTNYSAPKGTKELGYLTVKNGILYGLNYFPVVEQSLFTVDQVA